jgi:hypothetical protein
MLFSAALTPFLVMRWLPMTVIFSQHLQIWWIVLHNPFHLRYMNALHRLWTVKFYVFIFHILIILVWLGMFSLYHWINSHLLIVDLLCLWSMKFLLELTNKKTRYMNKCMFVYMPSDYFLGYSCYPLLAGSRC